MGRREGKKGQLRLPFLLGRFDSKRRSIVAGTQFGAGQDVRLSRFLTARRKLLNLPSETLLQRGIYSDRRLARGEWAGPRTGLSQALEKEDE